MVSEQMTRPVLLEPDGSIRLERRMVLASFAAAYLFSFCPVAAETVSDASLDQFLRLSSFLTGRQNLDRDQGATLLEALFVETPGVETDLRDLLSLIRDRRLPPERLQETLEGDGAPFAELPRKVMKAWYTGIVGEGGAARCITFETSLMHQAVSDRLSPPSYCYGSHGSWTLPPGKEG